MTDDLARQPHVRPMPEMPAVVVVHYRNPALDVQFDLEIAPTKANRERAKATGADLLVMHESTITSTWRPA